jgi:hypothetical protein
VRGVPRAILVVQSQAVTPEREDDYHDWYDNQHLDEVRAIPGIVDARRYTLVQAVVGPDGEIPPHLAIYEIETDDPTTIIDELTARAGDGRIVMSDALDMDPPPTTLLYVERS